MARAGVVVAVTAMLIGATGAGVLAGAVLVAGGFWAYTAIDGPSAPSKAEPAYAAATPVRPGPETAPVQATPVLTAAAPLPATPVAATAPKPSTTSSSPTRSSTAFTTRSTKPAPKPAATASDDLLADEDEWEAMGFDDAPDVEPGTPSDEEPVDDDEIDELLEDLDAVPQPKRNR